MGANERYKGHQAEREIVRALHKIGIDEAKRGLQYRDGAEVADVSTRSFAIESKHGKAINVRAALRQAAESATKGDEFLPTQIPVAVCRYHGSGLSEAVVAMYFEDFLLLAEAYERNNANRCP